MVSYKENPNLDSPVVTTYQDKKEYRENCRIKGGVYYIINEQCFLKGGRWYYIDGGKLVFDFRIKQWVLGAGSLNFGIVSINEDNSFVMGHFSTDPYYTVLVDTAEGRLPCLSYQLLDRKRFIENKYTGRWYQNDSIELNDYVKLRLGATDNDYRNKGYNIEDNAQEFPQKIALYEEFTVRPSKRSKRLAKLLGGITWGSELEFSGGGFPDYLQNQLGIVMCRDGSTSSGGEAVTVPYQGAKGLEIMKRLGQEATARMSSDISCSFHIHIGSVNLTRTNLVALYKLAEGIQDEIFQMFPYYKTDPSGVKSKNYNKKLSSLFRLYRKGELHSDFKSYINNAYKQIFRFNSEGQMPCHSCNKKQGEHPIRNKWDRPSRYSWINFMNVLFSTRRTVEFRLHGPTTNPIKMINWLFICNAIIKYAEANAKSILTESRSISLEEVLNYYKVANPMSRVASELSEYLNAYVVSRKADMKLDYSKRDVSGSRELNEDKQYSFSHKGTSLLF